MLVPLLAPNYKQHILSPAKFSRLKFVATRRIIKKNEVVLLSQLISFRIFMPTKEIIALWASYSTTEPVFYAISLPAL
jgi:hypothetical protein